MWIPHWLRKVAAQGCQVLSAARDFDKALSPYRKAATQGDAIAQGTLGAMYHQIHPKAAVYWFRKAAAQGNAEAQGALGAMYYSGHGVARNYAKAVYWFRKAATQGNTEAQYGLGLMYDSGHGVPQDYVQAAKWSILAKAGGVKDANELLSSLESEMTPAQIAEAELLALPPFADE